MTRTARETRGFRGPTWENQSGPRRCLTTNEGLTRSSDITREGLAVDATRTPSTPRRGRVVLTCGACGATFARYPSQLAGKTGVYYCSRACSHASFCRGTTLHCAMCDEPFVKQRSEQDSEHHFCSRSCYMEWRSVNRGDTYPRTGAVHLHRLAAEQALGRPLRPGEVVHHIDECKTNYAVENLAVFPSQSHHARCHQGGMSADELADYSLVNGAPAL